MKTQSWGFCQRFLRVLLIKGMRESPFITSYQNGLILCNRPYRWSLFILELIFQRHKEDHSPVQLVCILFNWSNKYFQLLKYSRLLIKIRVSCYKCLFREDTNLD